MKELSLEDEFAKILSEEMTKEIDKEIVETMVLEELVSVGWVKSPVQRPWGPFHDWASETAEWCHLHCAGNYRFLVNHWYFERPGDATAFTLRWA
jgi:hypothetical protein